MDCKGGRAADWGKPRVPSTTPSSQSETEKRLNPLDEAGFLSLSTMSWMTPVMWSMSRKQLDFSSLRLSPLDGADANGHRLQTMWEEEVCAVGPQRASLTRVLLRFQRDRLLLVLSINVLFMLSLFVGSGVLVFEILSHIIHIESASSWGGMALCFGLVSVELFRICCLTLSWSINLRTGIRMKTGFCMLGFNKILSLRTYSRASVLQMMNALTSDSNKVFSAVLLGPLVLPFPILLIICSMYTCYILNYTALIGFFIFIIFILLQLVFARLVNHFQQRAAIITASRVRTVKELLIYIKLIKMYVWEQAFSSRITETRTSEKKMLEKAAFIQNLSVTISPLAPVIAVMCTFVVHTWLGLPINVCTAYPVLTIFNCMRFILAIFPVADKILAEAAVSVKRLKKLLLIQNPEQYVLQKTDVKSAAVMMEKATLSWSKPLPPAASEDRDDLVSKTRQANVLPTLRNVSFTLKKGRLLGVCGNVGSGKTSLICSLLDQMHLQQGSISVDGSIAYVSQQAWIFYGTVQDNILMGEPLNWSRYNRVISCCSLEKDLSLLPHGDQTMLGEHGPNLSEGQKQRISLARAVYSNKDLYLLDDPLSAVDAHVGKHVFEECIRKQLEGKSIILVSHQLQYMEFCDEALVLKDGLVLETGSHQDLMRAEGHYAELINKHLKEQPHREEKKNVELHNHINGEMTNAAFHISAESTGTTSAYCTSADQLMDQKSSRKTLVTWRTFQRYCQAAGGYCVSLFILLIFILLMTNTAMCYWWLSFWLRHGHGTANVSSADNGNLSLNPDLPFYQLWFGVMIAVLLTLCMIKCFCYIKVTLYASTTLHSRLLRQEFLDLHIIWKKKNKRTATITAQTYSLSTDPIMVQTASPSTNPDIQAQSSGNVDTTHRDTVTDTYQALNQAVIMSCPPVIASPMSFFDMTPTSSIFSCFSRCQEEIDSLMPHHLNVVLSLCLIMLCICVINSLIFPVMLLPVFILVTVLSFLLWMFRGNIVQLKKMESISHSPCISLSSSIALGLSSIQTYNKTHNFTEQFKKLLDNTSNHVLLFLYGMRWLAFLADSLCAVMTLPVALLVVFVSNDVSSPAVKALALCFIVQLTSNSQRIIQSLLEVELRFVCVERQLHYIKSCESEDAGQLCVDQVSEDWPQHGAITFLDYKMRYRKNSPVILNDLQLHIRGGEKLGIVGRAGSGKSSLAMALFRLVEPTSGRILIDGIDITSVHLSDLRRTLSIIPQDPVLFTGTVRYNLDPYSRHSDEEIWTALEKTYMKDTICGLDGKLEAELTDNGGQLSVGQRQLMCLSRALLWDSRIFLLDDATASVDEETDALIQNTISEAFRGCTVLTITHRINRVLQADRILVLDNGEVVEFDPPDVLRQKPDSLFSQLLSAANTRSS